MSVNLGKKFISKKISISLDENEFFDLPKIIKSDEIKEIHQVNKMIGLSKIKLKNEIKKEMKKIKIMKMEINKKAEKEIIGKGLKCLNDFQKYRDEYFNGLEEHCTIVVRKAIAAIIGDLDDEQRFRFALDLAVKEVKEESNVVLKVNPRHESSVSDIKLERGWDIQFDRSFSLDECQIDVPLGGYRSSFKYSLDLVLGAINKPEFTNNEVG